MQHLVAFTLCILGPLLDLLTTPLFKRSTHRNRRMVWYGLTMAVSTLCTAVAAVSNPDHWLFSPLRPNGWWLPALATALTVLLVILLSTPVLKVLREPALRAKTHRKFEALAFVLPQTRAERLAFVLVCLVAGVSEEALFRGFLIRYFMASPYGLPISVAIAIPAICFGLNHAYQGWKGVISTAITGGFFLVLATGFYSLVPAMIIHALIDLRVLAFTLPEGHDLLAPEPA